MSVPEASMHENDFSSFWKNEIGLAGKSLVMQAIAIAPGEQLAPQ